MESGTFWVRKWLQQASQKMGLHKQPSWRVPMALRRFGILRLAIGDYPTSVNHYHRQAFNRHKPQQHRYDEKYLLVSPGLRQHWNLSFLNLGLQNCCPMDWTLDVANKIQSLHRFGTLYVDVFEDQIFRVKWRIACPPKSAADMVHGTT